MKTKKCFNCNRKIPEESNFCPYCMTKLVTEKGTDIKKPKIKKKTKKKILIISIIIIILAIVTIATKVIYEKNLYYSVVELNDTVETGATFKKTFEEMKKYYNESNGFKTDGWQSSETDVEGTNLYSLESKTENVRIDMNVSEDTGKVVIMRVVYISAGENAVSNEEECFNSAVSMLLPLVGGDLTVNQLADIYANTRFINFSYDKGIAYNVSVDQINETKEEMTATSLWINAASRAYANEHYSK